MTRILEIMLIVAGLCLALCTTAVAKERLSPATKSCLGCHQSMPGIVKQWEEVLIGMLESVATNATVPKKDPDAIDHYGFKVATIVSPKDCGQCHPGETAEQEASHHAEAGNILNSKDALLGQTLGGEPAVAVGCRQCHGSIVKANPDGTLDPATWPNTGIGRVNPDGSKGTCSACHTRHRFSKEQARKPEVCGKCHLGPDHPQKEVYEESKHGILYRAFEDELNLDHPKWVAGEDYFDAPTCASCHMSAAVGQPVTHDVGKRLSWNLRAPVSKRTADWEKKLRAMKDVCSACHAAPFVDGFYTQLDEAVELYNVKFAVPAKEIRDLLMDQGIISKQNFDDKIDWTYWELWHHEGRRARHGAAMSGPDYAWWHGFYDIAKSFYNKLLPEAKEACEKAGKPEVYQQIVKKYIDGRPEHEWYTKGFDPQRIKQIQQYYQERYQQEVR